jgi:hypothetical protein
MEITDIETSGRSELVPISPLAEAVPPDELIKLEWPTLARLKRAGWWVALYLPSIAIGGLLAKLFPLIGGHPWYVLGAILVTPIIYSGVDQSARLLHTSYKRFKAYDAIFTLSLKRNQDFIQSEQRRADTWYLTQELLATVLASKQITVEKVQVFNKRISLLLKPRRGARVVIGDQLTVVDLTGGAVMGTFQITQIDPICQAKALADLDPLWSGYIRDAGSETSLPPESVAILMERDRN